jgi:Zn finger protein HypA/HybF involved in hydrogenase expression
VTVAYLNRTLDQELTAIVRGASLECLVCGEFLLHASRGVIACPECGSNLVDGLAAATAGEQEQLSSG